MPEVIEVEVQAIKDDLSALKQEMHTSLAGVSTEVKELTKALRQLIRLDGDLGRVADLANRIGKEVDGLATLMREQFLHYDERLRKVENNQAGNNKSVTLFDGLVRHGLALMLGMAVGVLVIKAIG